MRRNKKINLIRKRRQNRTRAKIQGTGARPRASIFRSNKFLYVQLIDDKKSQTLASAVVKKGVKEAAKLGEKIAELAKKAGIKGVLFDRGAYKYHGQVKAVAEAMRNTGLKI